ncbi:protein FAM3C-like, partial [Morone saxatilis]|uniref:protein FAM3C-like n=1 Tax=Morone saxatilis TaxID=34816 RepID=UPI0015E256CB
MRTNGQEAFGAPATARAERSGARSPCNGPLWQDWTGSGNLCFSAGVVQFMFVLVPLVLFLMLILQYYGNPFEADWRQVLPADMFSRPSKVPLKQSAGPCVHRTCPEDNFSFSIHSGAANVVGPKICVQKKVVLGTMLNNAGYGINIAIINGKTGEVIKTDHFDMYSGDVKPLIELLKSIE